MTKIDPEDQSEAQIVGIVFGSVWPDLGATNDGLSVAFGNYSNDRLNDIAVRHGKRIAGLAEDEELTDAQAAGELPYLHALGGISLREMQWAIYWRRESVRAGDGDPGRRYVDFRFSSRGREILEGWGPSAVGRVVVAGNDGDLYQPDADESVLRQEMRRERESAHDSRKRVLDGAARRDRADYLRKLQEDEDRRIGQKEDLSYVDFETFSESAFYEDEDDAMGTGADAGSRIVFVPEKGLYVLEIDSEPIEQPWNAEASAERPNSQVEDGRLSEQTAVTGAEDSVLRREHDDQQIVDELEVSPRYMAQLRRAGRAAVDRQITRQVVTALAASPGGLPTAEISRRLGMLPTRVGGTMAALRRVLNVEGYEVLRSVDGGERFVLDVRLLRDQFDLAD